MRPWLARRVAPTGLRRRVERRRGSHRLDSPPEREPASMPGLAPVRTPRVVEGVIASVDERAADDHVPAVVAQVREADGGEVALVWLGRRHIGGIEPGVAVRARGLAATHRTRPAIFNPAYELVPSPRTEEQP